MSPHTTTHLHMFILSSGLLLGPESVQLAVVTRVHIVRELLT